MTIQDSEPDLVIAGTIAAASAVLKKLGKCTMVLLASEPNLDTEKAYTLGCIDVMSVQDLETSVGKLLTYARISNAQRTVKKILAKPL